MSNSTKISNIKLTAFFLLAFGLIGSGFYWINYRGSLGLSQGSFKDFNAILITFDTTRADHLPIYGYKGVKTPEIDQFAKDCFIFDDAVSQVPLTLPSHVSMMTGLLPMANGVRDNSGFILDDRITTLAEILKANGYSTSAFVSSFVLDSRWNLDQGFDFYYDNFNLAEFKELNAQDAQRSSEETVSEFEEWLETHKGKTFFSWIHFYDPHEPYTPPEPYKSVYRSNPYDGEIAYMDANFGKIIKKLEQYQIKDRTIIVVAGDHGESLGQHDELTHAMFVYNATQHVPLLIHVPGAAQKRITETVRLIDIQPTILDLLGIPQKVSIQGASLIPLINGSEKNERAAYAESLYAELHYGWSSVKSISTKQYKFIDVPKPELYDRLNDPEETVNLIEEKRSTAKLLKEKLEGWVTVYTRKDLSSHRKMDSETLEKLRSLGYIGDSVKPSKESDQVNPKDKIQLARALEEARDLSDKGEYKKGLETLLPVLQEDPNMVDAHFLAGLVYLQLRDYSDAIDQLTKTLALNPEHMMAIYNLGYTYELMGKLTEAESWFLKVLNIEENNLYAKLKLAHIYRQLNQPEKARIYFLQVVKAYDEFLDATKNPKLKSELHSTLGELYFGAGDFQHAEENYLAAIQGVPDRPSLHYNLAQIYEARGQIGEAEESYRNEITIDPKNFKAYNNLGLIYRNSNRLNEAVECFKKVVELRPDDQQGYLLLASTYSMLGEDQKADQVLLAPNHRH